MKTKNTFLKHIVVVALIAVGFGLGMTLLSHVLPNAPVDHSETFILSSFFFLLIVVSYFIKRKR